ncbi:MAG: hypothetical protein ACRD0G_03625, partial [Acidimicrobiales bacterium]
VEDAAPTEPVECLPGTPPSPLGGAIACFAVALSAPGLAVAAIAIVLAGIGLALLLPFALLLPDDPDERLVISVDIDNRVVVGGGAVPRRQLEPRPQDDDAQQVAATVALLLLIVVAIALVAVMRRTPRSEF